MFLLSVSLLLCSAISTTSVGIAPAVWEKTFAVDCVSPYIAVEAIENDYRDWSSVDVVIEDVDVGLTEATITYYIANTDAAVIFCMDEDGTWDAGRIVNLKGDYGIIYWDNGVPDNSEELYDIVYYKSAWSPDFDVLYETAYVPENAYLIFKGYPGDRFDMTEGQ